MGCCCFSTPLENEQPNDGFGDWPFTEFLLSDLTTATKNFSSDEIISGNAEDSSNVVYKGLLSENHGFIAVKRFKNSYWPDHEEFAEDAKAVGELKHKRLVKLLGYCCDENERLLVSEFMPDDTLAKRLFHQKNQAMECSMRLRVAYHIAEALDYCNSAGFASYNNLSAYSVLFDKDGEAGLSCFGLIKAINYDRSQITRGIVNPKSVTYRFGTILVNLLTGMQIPPSNAPEMINGKYVTELMDPNLKGKFSTEEAAVVSKLASECLQCEARKSLITKELVATLKALQTKTQIPYIQMLELEKQHEVGASSSQQQQVEPLKEYEDLETPNTKEIVATLETLQTRTEVPSHEVIEMTMQQKEASSSSHLSPLGEACSRMDLESIHKIMVSTAYVDDKDFIELSFEEWIQEVKELQEVRKHGDRAFVEQDFETAIACYSQFIEDRTMVYPSVYARRSLCYLFCNEPEKALLDGMNAQGVYPDWPTAFFLQSMALAKLNMNTDSADTLKEAAILEAKKQQQ